MNRRPVSWNPVPPTFIPSTIQQPQRHHGGLVNDKQRRSIALDYWVHIALAVFVIISGTAQAGWHDPGPGSYFAATFLIIHAHGRRIRDTMIALHEGATK